MNYWLDEKELKKLSEEERNNYTCREIDFIRLNAYKKANNIGDNIPITADLMNDMEQWYLDLAGSEERRTIKDKDDSRIKASTQQIREFVESVLRVNIIVINGKKYIPYENVLGSTLDVYGEDKE